MNKRTWNILRIILGGYLVWVGVRILMEVSLSRPVNRVMLNILAVLFIFIGAGYALFYLKQISGIKLPAVKLRLPHLSGLKKKRAAEPGEEHPGKEQKASRRQAQEILGSTQPMPDLSVTQPMPAQKEAGSTEPLPDLSKAEKTPAAAEEKEAGKTEPLPDLRETEKAPAVAEEKEAERTEPLPDLRETEKAPAAAEEKEAGRTEPLPDPERTEREPAGAEEKTLPIGIASGTAAESEAAGEEKEKPAQPAIRIEAEGAEARQMQRARREEAEQLGIEIIEAEDEEQVIERNEEKETLESDYEEK